MASKKKKYLKKRDKIKFMNKSERINFLNQICILLVVTYPGAFHVDGDEHGRDGEVVHEGPDLEHEVQLVIGRYKL